MKDNPQLAAEIEEEIRKVLKIGKYANMDENNSQESKIDSCDDNDINTEDLKTIDLDIVD